MTETSSLDLANALVRAAPGPDDDKRSYEALRTLAAKDEFSKEDRFMVALDAALSRIDPGKDAVKLGLAASFLSSSGMADTVAPDLAGRHVLSLVKLQSEPVEGLSPEAVSLEMNAGALSPETGVRLSAAMVEMTTLSDDDLVGISARVSPERGGWTGRTFPSVIEEDVEKAIKVTSLHPEGLDPFEAKVSRAVDVLDAEKSDDRLVGAVSRVFADKRVFGEEQDVGDMAVRLASDVTAQIRSAEIISKIDYAVVNAEVNEVSSDPGDDFSKIALMAARNEGVRKDLEAESEGRFSDLSRSAALDVRSDIVSGESIPFMSSLLRLEASRREASRSAALSAQASGMEI